MGLNITYIPPTKNVGESVADINKNFEELANAVDTIDSGSTEGIKELQDTITAVGEKVDTKADKNHTHSPATTSANGLMSATDKTKLDGIATGANAYVLPTASATTLGGVKTTSTVLSATGHTPCPIISGVPYYKDTTYSALKNPYALTLQGNGTTLPNGTYDGSAAKTVNITPSSIGAVALTTTGVNEAINRLTTGNATPVDADYFISQYQGGGTTSKTYHRRPVSTLYTYMKGKMDSVYAASSHTHSYLPLAGGTMNDDSKIITQSSKDGRKTGITAGSVRYKIPSDGSFAMGDYWYTDDDFSNELGTIGAYGSANDISFFYVGGTYNDPLLKVTKSNGNVTAKGIVTATSFSGNASSATKWATARNINGLSVDGSANRVNYGTCSTAAATAAKTVACNGFALIDGAEITVKFKTTNTAANPTLNVNSTGAKSIYYRGTAITAGYLATNRIYTFRYNGIQYELVGDINTETKVAHSYSNDNGWYQMLLGTATTGTVTETPVGNSSILANPSTGVISAKAFHQTIGGKLLYDGSIGSNTGSITISGLTNYNAVLIVTDGVGISGTGSNVTAVLPITYLANGNSITVGGGIPSGTKSYDQGTSQALTGIDGKLTVSIDTSDKTTINLTQSVGVIGNIKVYSL